MANPAIDETFISRFGASPGGYCQAPGRINLIGEHLDYNGLPVLPMTIDRRVRVAYGPGEGGRIRIENLDARFAPAQFVNAPSIPESGQGAWDNYARAVVRELNAHFAAGDFPGLHMVVEATLPDGAGLGSSSALMVAVALAYLDRLGIRIDKDISRFELSGLLARAERGTGIAGGGMDQTIALAGDEVHAVKIDFNPPRIERIPCLGSHRFVVCNSMVEARKTGAARHLYNEGPAACRVARALVERYLQAEWDPGIELRDLGDLWFGPLCLTHEEAGKVFDKAIPAEPLGFEDAARRIGCSVAELRATLPRDFPEPARGFRLRAMVRHVRTEFRRVEWMRDALIGGDAEGAGESMTASHKSCASDYGVSCPELDALVRAALEAGAIGSRMTGAGFGGCTISLVEEEMTGRFVQGMADSYYGGAPPPNAILPVRAAPGAGYC